jgi:hypothetical protein
MKLSCHDPGALRLHAMMIPDGEKAITQPTQ